MEQMERVERRNISIYPSQWAIIDRKAADVGNPHNSSAGLKALIAEYERIKSTPAPQPTQEPAR